MSELLSNSNQEPLNKKKNNKKKENNKNKIKINNQSISVISPFILKNLTDLPQLMNAHLLMLKSKLIMLLLSKIQMNTKVSKDSKDHQDSTWDLNSIRKTFYNFNIIEFML